MPVTRNGITKARQSALSLVASLEVASGKQLNFITATNFQRKNNLQVVIWISLWNLWRISGPPEGGWPVTRRAQVWLFFDEFCGDF
ncbi:MAG: hypothetical protein ACRDRU_21690 [Pseudonocardiaceae bacterium]